MQPQVDEVGPDTPIGDIVVIEGDNNPDIAEEEGAGQLEQDGASHVEEEGASTVEAGASHAEEEGANTDAENGHEAVEHNVEIPQGRYNLDRIPPTTPGAEPPRDAKDSGSARSHSTHLETSSSNRP